MFVRWSNLTLDGEEQRRLPGYRDEAVVRRFDAPEALETRFYEVRARSVLNRVPTGSNARSEGVPAHGGTHAASTRARGSGGRAQPRGHPDGRPGRAADAGDQRRAGASRAAARAGYGGRGNEHRRRRAAPAWR